MINFYLYDTFEECGANYFPKNFQHFVELDRFLRGGVIGGEGTT